MSLSRYRAWDKENDRMIYPSNNDVYFNLTDDGISIEDLTLEPYDGVFPLLGSVLMQSTGLKDKNGVEIFEGDVVVGQQNLTTDSSTPFEIKGLVRYSKRNTMFYLDEKSFGHDKFMNSLGSSIYQFEVIGNVFANPELLEVE